MILYLIGEGEGKSALSHYFRTLACEYNERYQVPVENQLLFVCSKPNQLPTNIPYTVFIPIVETIIQNILAQSNYSHIQYWKRKILDVLDNNACVVLPIFPTLKYLVGSTFPDSKYLPNERMNRLNVVLPNFLCSLTCYERPLVIFLVCHNRFNYGLC